MAKGDSAFNWRNHYGNESSDDRRLKIGRNEKMIDICDEKMIDTGTAGWDTNATWPVEFVVSPASQEPVSLFIVPLANGDELLIAAAGKHLALTAALTHTTQKILFTATKEIALPALGVLHVFEGGKEK